MAHLPATATDAELISFVDRWAGLLECEDYVAACAFTEKGFDSEWTAALIRDVIKGYDETKPSQIVTLHGRPSDVAQRKIVSRWPLNIRGDVGDIWYDLNIDGIASDLTAIFRVLESRDGLIVRLDSIHVM